MVPNAFPATAKTLLRLCLPVLATGWALALWAADGTPASGRAAAASARPIDAPSDWARLSPAQQTALKPLAKHWSELSRTQQKKWLALSADFGRMSPSEQARLHDRMAQWATLSPQQRTQARLNFAELQQVPPEDKRERWEVYQALTPEQRKALANSVAPKTPHTPLAPSIKVVPKPKPAASPPPPQPASAALPASPGPQQTSGASSNGQ
ncbi:MAG: hypothetical protein OHK0048_16550 [Rhodoferax sp.]